ncbi:MAG: leucine-rich repeat protein [Sedimentisphaerales bacterium]|nr:leucine-rich repeat protein [Sedimentisphaerales bacterium]
MKDRSWSGAKDIKNAFLGVTLSLIGLSVLVFTGCMSAAQSEGSSYLVRARELYDDYDFMEAYTLLEEGLEKYPDDEDLNYWLIRTVNASYWLKSTHPEKSDLFPAADGAAEWFHDGPNVKIVTEIGRFHWLKNNREKARDCFERAIEINPEYYPAYNYLGNYYYILNRVRSRKYYEKLFALKPAVLDFLGIAVHDEYLVGQILECNNLKELYLAGASPDLLEGIGALTDLEILYLTGQNLTSNELHTINSLKNLKVLSLHANKLTKIAGLENLADLRILHLNDNRIRRIENLDRLKHLRVLDLRSNRIDKLENLEALTDLRHLYLDHNRISKIENLDTLTRLTVLEVYDNQIQKLENLSGCTQLRVLNFYFNQISSLENLDTLTQLQRLYLRGNQISRLENLDSQVNLEILDLYDNQVKKLENLSGLNHLRELILCNNQIIRLEGLDTLTRLQILDLRKNRIRKIENLDRLTNLQTLMLSFNGIKRLENLDGLRNLKDLYVSYNQISRIENLDSLISLRNLYLGGGIIPAIENLDGLTRLEVLYLADNKISKMENLAHLTNLQTLFLGSNKIGRIENPDPPPHLETLDLLGNEISEVKTISNLGNVRHLYLARNQIGMVGETTLEIPSSFSQLKSLIIGGPDYMRPGNIKYIKGIQYLKHIEELEISYQNILELPDLSFMDQLKKLHLEKCVNLETIDYQKIPAGVKSLTLWNVNLKDLKGIERLAGLEVLWIGDNPGLTSVSHLHEIDTLNELNVGLCAHLPAEEILKLDNLKTVIVGIEQYPPPVIESLQKKGIKVQSM